jgi:hypothetical protein
VTLNSMRHEQDKFKELVTDLLKASDNVHLTKAARFKSDVELHFGKLDLETKKLSAQLDAQATDNGALAQAIAMLVENVNMQMEAETQDIAERRSVALYAGSMHEEAQAGDKLPALPSPLTKNSSMASID